MIEGELLSLSWFVGEGRFWCWRFFSAFVVVAVGGRTHRGRHGLCIFHCGPCLDVRECVRP